MITEIALFFGLGRKHTHQHHHMRVHAFARALAWCRLPFSIAFQQQQGRARNRGCRIWKKDHQKREQFTSRPANVFNVSIWTKGGERRGTHCKRQNKQPQIPSVNLCRIARVNQVSPGQSLQSQVSSILHASFTAGKGTTFVFATCTQSKQLTLEVLS